MSVTVCRFKLGAACGGPFFVGREECEKMFLRNIHSCYKWLIMEMSR